jgi:multimeric flavodoxin WrbA
MKVVAFNGCNRRDGNTALVVGHVFGELERGGIDTEMIQLAEERVRGCIASFRC